MKTEEKIGQMLLVGFHGTSITNETRHLIRDYNVGGVILFSRNIESPKQIGNLAFEIQQLEKKSSSKIPLFFSIDHEGGKIVRVKEPFTKFEPASTLGKIGSSKLTRDYSIAMAKELSAVGINMNFAPVLDLSTNPENPVIGDRSFSSNPDMASKMGFEVMEGMHSQGIISVGKHFPGHGGTSEDSHFKLPVVFDSFDQLMNAELKPFIYVIKNGIDAIMPAHVLYPKVDSKNCATLSKKILQELLREKLEFDGVILSDDMEMKAVYEGADIGDVSIKAILAGVDILLICKNLNNIKIVYQALLNAVKNGVLPILRVDESVNRILALKNKFNITSKEISMDNIENIVGHRNHKKIADEIKRLA